MSKQGFSELQRIFGEDLVRDDGDGHYIASVEADHSFENNSQSPYTLTNGDTAEDNVYKSDTSGLDDFSQRLRRLGVNVYRKSTSLFFDSVSIETPRVIQYLKKYLKADQFVGAGHEKKKELEEIALWRLNKLGDVKFGICTVNGERYLAPQKLVLNAQAAAFHISDRLGVSINISSFPKGPGFFTIPMRDLTQDKLAELKGLKISDYLKAVSEASPQAPATLEMF